MQDIKKNKIINRLSVCLLFLIIIGIGVFVFLNLFQAGGSKNIVSVVETAEVVGAVGEEKLHYANPNEIDFYETVFKFVKNKVILPDEVIGGVIPHHLLAGDLIAEFFSGFEGRQYDSIILIGPNHFDAGVGEIITSMLDWETPYGVLPSDTELVEEFLELEGLTIEEEIFEKEHSINSEVAFIKKTFPDTKILPLVLNASINAERAGEIGEFLFEVTRDKNVLVIVSADFSHYRDSKTAQADDEKSIKAITDLSFEDIYDIEVDSPASVYTLLKYSELKNAEFALLNNSNSALLVKKPEILETTSYVTGYFILKKNKLPRSEEIKKVNMLFLGDLMLDRYVGKIIKKKGLDFIFEKLDKKFFENHDLVGANLEGAVADDGNHYSPQRGYDFSFHPDLINELKKYNFDFFNIANNHLADQGRVGIDETRKNLDKLDFDFVGCEDMVIDNCSFAVIERNNMKIGMVGISSVRSLVDIKKAREQVAKLASSTDLVVANVHWGNEYQNKHNGRQTKLAHSLIDTGVDIIIGHHPHVVGGVEIYKNKLIFYSLGNFVFDQYFSKNVSEELGVEINIVNKEIEVILHPIKSNYSQLELMSGEDRDKFLTKLSSWSVGDDGFKKQVKEGLIFVSLDNN